jgi:hypothetical protein
VNVLEPSGSDLSSTIKALGEAFPESLKWEWDDRFDGVLAAFEVTDKDRMLTVLNARFGQAWDGTSISDAPGSISGAAKDFGGLTANQLLFTSDWNHEVMLLGFWWPWGNGATISIRLVPYGSATSDSDKETARSALRGTFGI